MRMCNSMWIINYEEIDVVIDMGRYMSNNNEN